MKARAQALTALNALGVCCVLAILRGFVYTAASSPPFGHTTATFFTLAALAIATAISLAHNRPWESKGRITERHVVRLVTVGALLALTTCASVYTLRVVGPVRATILEHLDLALVPGLGYFFCRNRRTPVIRGVVLALLAALMIAWYDPGAVELAQHQAETAGGLRALGVEGVRAEAAAANVAAAAGAGGALGQGALPFLPRKYHRAALYAASTNGSRPLPTPLVHKRFYGGSGGGGGEDENNAAAAPPEPHMAGGAIDSVLGGAAGGAGAAAAPPSPADPAAADKVAGPGRGMGRFGTTGDREQQQGPPSPPPSSIVAALQAAAAEAEAAGAAARGADGYDSSGSSSGESGSDGAGEEGAQPGEDSPASAAQEGDDSLGLLDAYEDLLQDGYASGGAAAADDAEKGSADAEGSGVAAPAAQGDGSVDEGAGAINAPPAVAAAASNVVVQGKNTAAAGGAPPLPPQPKGTEASAEPEAAAQPVAPPQPPAAAAAAAAGAPPLPRKLLELPGGGGGGGGFAPPRPPSNPQRKNAAKNAGLYLLRQAARLRAILSLHARSSVLVACVFLGLASWANNIRRTIEKGLVQDTGLSPRRLHAIVLTAALLLWVPVTVFRGWVLSLWGDASPISDALPMEGSASGWGRAVLVKELVRLAALAVRGGDASALNAPSALWFTVVAAAFAVGVLLLGEFAADIPISGLETLKGGLVPPSLLPQKLKSEGSGASDGGSVGGAGGAAVALGAAGSASSGSSSSSSGSGSGGSSTHASAAASTLLRLCSALTAMLTASALSSGPALPGSPTQISSPLLWVGLALSLLGLAQAGGLDAMQLSRLYSSAMRGGSAVIGAGSGSGGAAEGGGGGEGCCSVLGLLLGSSGSSSSSGSYSSGVGDGKYDKAGGAGGGLVVQVRKVMAHIWEDQNSRRIFQFLTINFLFMFVEIFVGFYSNSLGLISDAGHMFFDNASLFIGLYASYMARWKPDARFTYGYSRYEVLAGFVNAIFLVFVAISVVMEAMERLWEPPEIRGDHLLVVSVGGLLVNILGLIFFHDVAHAHGGHGHGGGECSGHGHGANENMMGVYLHVLADALGSVGVIISSLLIQWYGWHLADPITSIIISFMILLSVGPLIAVTAGPLLSRMPEHMEEGLREAVSSVERTPEVLSVSQPHFWKQHSDHIVGSLHITIAPGSDRQKVFTKVLGMFHELGVVRAAARSFLLVL